MRITESQLRRIIRESIINEDLQGFINRTSEIHYDPPQDFANPDMSTFINDPENRSKAKDVKRAWAAEADHDFMRSLIKIHWVFDADRFKRFVSMSRRNEISTKGYLPGSKVEPLGSVGVIVQGHVTLAANSQEVIYSGMSGMLPDEVHKHFASSGTPKRSRNFTRYTAGSYALDKNSFRPTRHNELIVDNWKPIGVISDVPEGHLIFNIKDKDSWVDWRYICRWALDHELPIYDINMKQVPNESIEQALSEAEQSEQP